jgi:hypothetical protein
VFDPEIYESFLQRHRPSFSIVLRSNGEPDTLSSPLRQAVAQLDVELPLARVMMMEEVIDHHRAGNPLFIRLLSTFAFLALLLAAIAALVEALDDLIVDGLCLAFEFVAGE